MKNIVVFASGSGTNAENIIRFFQESEVARVRAVLTDNPKAGVIERIRPYNVPAIIFNAQELSGGKVGSKLSNLNPHLIVLAGFLRKIPAELISAYPSRIVNIHPALLPDYGGPGMYGEHVHRAVVENEDEVSGISIHYVTEEYDEGEIIFQEEVELDPDDTWQDVEYKVRQLEYKHYPEVIEYIINQVDAD